MDGDVACREGVDACATVVHDADVTLSFRQKGVAEHVGHLVLDLEGLFGLGHHALEERIVAEVVYHRCHELVLVGELLHLDVFCLLLGHLTLLQREADVGDHGQTVLVLRDEHTVMQGFLGGQLGVAMAADDEVEPGETLCHLEVFLIADVRQQNLDIPVLAESLIPSDDVLGLREADALHILGVGVRAPHRVHLYHADDAHLDAVDVEHLGRYDVETSLRRGEHVGTDIAEVRIAHQRCQRLHVELMVADGGGVEAHLVHQRHHGIRRNLVHVVEGITRAVVACREHEQRGIELPQAVGYGG